MGTGWVELLIYCGCAIWCKGINPQVFKQLRADYQELRGLESFHGESVAGVHRQARAAGWQLDLASGCWQCPVCLAAQADLSQDVRNP